MNALSPTCSAVGRFCLPTRGNSIISFKFDHFTPYLLFSPPLHLFPFSFPSSHPLSLLLSLPFHIPIQFNSIQFNSIRQFNLTKSSTHSHSTHYSTQLQLQLHSRRIRSVPFHSIRLPFFPLPSCPSLVLVSMPFVLAPLK